MMLDNFITEPMLCSNSQTTIALKANGTVWAWGQNRYGELGNSNNELGEFNFTPTRVMGSNALGYLDKVKYIACNGYTAAAVKHDGTLWMWGRNNNGQLGNGATSDSQSTPVQVKGINGIGYLENVKKVSMSGENTLALLENGTVVVWGNARPYILPDGSNFPIQLFQQYFSNVKDILAIGNLSVFTLNANGTIYAVGASANTGTGSNEPPKVPTLVVQENGSTLTNIVAIDYSGAVTSSGEIWVWGTNLYGRLGNGVNDVNQYEYSAIKVRGVNGVGTLNNIEHTTFSNNSRIAISRNSEAYCWGHNVYGALGIDSSTEPVVYVARSPVMDNMLIVYSGGGLTMLAKPDGTVWTVGYKAADMANDGETGSTHVPQQVFESPGGKEFNLFDDEEAIDPPDPGPDPSPGDCNKCCDCCCRPIIFNGPVTGPVNIYCNGNCKVSCEDKTEE